MFGPSNPDLQPSDRVCPALPSSPLTQNSELRTQNSKLPWPSRPSRPSRTQNFFASPDNSTFHISHSAFLRISQSAFPDNSEPRTSLAVPSLLSASNSELSTQNSELPHPPVPPPPKHGSCYLYHSLIAGETLYALEDYPPHAMAILQMESHQPSIHPVSHISFSCFGSFSSRR